MYFHRCLRDPKLGIALCKLAKRPRKCKFSHAATARMGLVHSSKGYPRSGVTFNASLKRFVKLATQTASVSSTI